MPSKKPKTIKSRQKTTLSVKKTSKKNIMLDVYSIKGRKVNKTKLPQEVFGVKPNPKLLAQAVRIYLANKRSGTHSTKTRSEVVGSTRKIYRQKGTGRARHGDIKAPIFRKGGVAHGPKPKDYSLDFPVKMRRKALFLALSEKQASDKINVVSGLDKMEIKTKEMVNFLDKMAFDKGAKKKQKYLLVLSKMRKNNYLAGRNLKYLSIMQAKLLNAYEVLSHEKLLIEKEAIKQIVDTFSKSNKKAKREAQKQEDKPKQALKKEIKPKVSKKKTTKTHSTSSVQRTTKKSRGAKKA